LQLGKADIEAIDDGDRVAGQQKRNQPPGDFAVRAGIDRLWHGTDLPSIFMAAQAAYVGKR
jgi:hypothetical protein